MSDLIPIFDDNFDGEYKQSVDARELHSFLEVQTRYNDWIARRIEEFQFIENEDFIILLKNELKGRGRPSLEYHVTFDMAKELSMVERNEKGREARRYFIEVEKRFRHETQELETTDPYEMIRRQAMQTVQMIDEMRSIDKRTEALEAGQQDVLERLEKVEAHGLPLEYMAAIAFCNLNNIREPNAARALGTRAVRYCRDHGIHYYSKAIPDAHYGGLNAYHRGTLRIVAEQLGFL